MHVGFSLLTLFPGRVGGSETYVRGLLGEFARGHGPERLTVLANRHVVRAYGDAGVPLRLVRSYRPGDRDATRFAAMNLARLAPGLIARDVPRDLDLLHLPLTVPVGTVPGVPRVVTVHDVQHHELPQMFSGLERRFRAWAYDGAARDAQLVTTMSEHARAGIVRYLGVPADRVVAIPLGVDHARFQPDGERRAERRPYLVYPANLWPHKNHARLLEAYGRIGRTLGVDLVLTGQTFGRDLPVPASAGGVRHLGHVAAGDVPALYRGARAVIFPSLFEGFGLPVLEAMACGTPVAASRRGALAELAGDAALTFDPEDVEVIAAAMERIALDDTLRAHLREAGLARAARYTWRATADAYRLAYGSAAQVAA